MGESHGALCEENTRVERIEANRLVQAFDRSIGIAGVAADPTASLPGDGQVHIQIKGSIDEQQCTIKVAKEVCMHVPRPTQRDRVIGADVGSALDQPRDLLFIEGRGPAIRFGKMVTRSSQPVRGRKVAVFCYCRVKQLQRFGIFFPRPSIPAGKSPRR